MNLRVAEALRTMPLGGIVPSKQTGTLLGALAPIVGAKAAKSIVLRAGTHGVLRMRAPELAAVAGVPLKVAERVTLARDLGVALREDQRVSISCSDDIAKALPLGLANLDFEVVLAIAMNARFEVLATILLSQGGGSQTALELRDIFAPLMRLRARAFVMVHNHPSADLTPSAEDVTLTNRVVKAGDILHVELVDHLIISTRGTLSFREVGLMPEPAELSS
jgi:DNA repair protein RadC